jgi:hypothetical protein
MLDCGRMSQRTIAILPALRRELPWLALMAFALLASAGFAHLLIRNGVILPSIAASGGAPPWAWAALYAPEVVVALMIGWRLRSWVLVLLYAGAAATVREGFHLALRWAGDTAAVAPSAAAELAIALPVSVVGYAVVFALAAASAREGTELPRDRDDKPPAPTPPGRGHRGDGRSGMVQR